MIRAARAEDAAAIARVHVTSWRETYTGLLPVDVIAATGVEERERQWDAWIARPDCGVFVAELDATVVGFAAVAKNRDKRFSGAYPGELCALYILRAQHRLGVGRSLFDGAREWFCERELQAFMVLVLAENPAVAFYERLGGTFICTEPRPLRTIEALENAYGWRYQRSDFEANRSHGN